MINQTVRQGVQNVSRNETERSFRESIVFIDYISPDMTRALVRMQPGPTHEGDQFEVRILQIPGVNIPTDVSNYVGLLHGDPKSPIGIQLIPKAVVQPDMTHAIPTSSYGYNRDKVTTPVVGRMMSKNDTITQQLNNRVYPQDHTVVIKPSPPIDPEYLGANRLTVNGISNITDNPAAYVSVSEDEVRLIGDIANGIIISPISGVSMYGKINIGSSIQDVRIGGAWIFNPMHQFQIPSTAVTPQPVLVYNPPLATLGKGMPGAVAGIAGTPGA